ncbi:DUF4240 domain-containing protein [Shewanella intestini]|uniref:DUF4240 domain-containing protein n=1 Tax=Shewanella intestini TaxID=2017544 RepID=A0ABS5I0M5_9GAMM|nr:MULTISPECIES: DUF4240 domain-containing protein [Shewanella]MBR9727579.1 DUF4240 domain-containing protein [Shewanella intestini]MRG35271.1 DUF4240 domain-containing protein [Shewanella sp. XMDDZSB0408]
MTPSQFWALVTRTSATQSSDECVAALKMKLSNLDDDELAAFDKWFGQQLRKSYTWDVWGAAYVVTGCDSEHGFTEFQCFLLSLGEQVYHEVINDPDSLAKLDAWPLVDNYAYPFIEDYDLIAGQIFEDRNGHELPFVPAGTHAPAGKKFNQKPKFLRKSYPLLSQAFPF